MDLTREFTGGLYQGDQVTKGWNAIGKGHLTLRVVSCNKINKWKLEAKKDEEKVWECLIQEPFSHKLRDNFIQWNLTSASKEKLTFGFRIKDVSLAQDFAGILGYIASSPPAQERQLSITLPSKQKIVLTFKKSMTMASVLKYITSHNGLEHSLYALAAAGSSSLKPQMTVSNLESSDIIVIKRHKPAGDSTSSEKPTKEPSPATAKHEETMLLNVTLPNEEIIEINVKPSITLLELQRLICIQNSLNPAAHKFDLMIANQDKIRLRQLKISSISLIRKEGISEGTEGTDGGNLKTKIRMAPPPPKSPANRLNTQRTHSPLSRSKGIESTDGTTEDINDVVSKMLYHHAIGTDSPSRDLTRRKLNPAPPPPQVGAKQTKLDKPSAKRIAPPPPKGSHTPSAVQEEVDSNEKEVKQTIPAHRGIPLPCMTTMKQPQQKKKGTPQETRKLSPLVSREAHSGENPIRNTPPLSYSPGKRPTRKAPAKPPSKASGSSSNQSQMPPSPKPKGAELKNNVASQEEENRIIVTTSHAKGQSQTTGGGAFVFKIPPPPPRKSPAPEQQKQVDTTPLKHELSVDESDEESEETNSTAGSSMYGGYNIESAKALDQEQTSSGTETSENSDDEENSETESDSEGDSQDETDSNTDQTSNADNEHTDQGAVEAKNDNLVKAKTSILPAEPESSSDEDAGDEGVLLLSHQTTESSLLQDESVLGSNAAIQSSDAVDKITSLRNLIADTCEIGGEGNKRLNSQSSIGSDADFDLTTIRQMGPPPDTTASSVVPDQSTSPPTAPPPPPIGRQAPPPAPKPKPPPPAVKPKPHPQSIPGNAEDELAMKLKRRQLLMSEPQAPRHTTTSPVASTVTNEPPIHQTSVPNPVVISGGGVSGGGVSTTSVGGGTDMQAQLQMLQQQMLQQQMMQLQHQFQQLQSMMVTNPSPASNLLLQQQMQQMQQLQSMGVPLQQPTGTLQAPQMMMMQPQAMIHPSFSGTGVMGPQMLPQQSLNPSLLVANQPVMTPSVQPAAQAFQQIPGFMPQGMSFAPSPPPVPTVPPPAPPPPPSIEIEPPTGPAKSLSRKPSEADVRMKALGSATGTFDNLMDEVRDTNPSEILKKAPEKDKADHDSAYTGMTAALVQAMKERRKSFQDTSYDYKRESTGSSHDWETEETQN